MAFNKQAILRVSSLQTDDWPNWLTDWFGPVKTIGDNSQLVDPHSVGTGYWVLVLHSRSSTMHSAFRILGIFINTCPNRRGAYGNGSLTKREIKWKRISLGFFVNGRGNEERGTKWKAVENPWCFKHRLPRQGFSPTYWLLHTVTNR